MLRRTQVWKEARRRNEGEQVQMKTLKKIMAAIGKAIFAVFGPNLVTGKDLAIRISPVRRGGGRATKVARR